LDVFVFFVSLVSFVFARSPSGSRSETRARTLLQNTGWTKTSSISIEKLWWRK